MSAIYCLAMRMAQTPATRQHCGVTACRHSMRQIEARKCCAASHRCVEELSWGLRHPQLPQRTARSQACQHAGALPPRHMRIIDLLSPP